MAGATRTGGAGRLVSCVAWALLLVVLWQWGRDLTETGTIPRTVLGERPSVSRLTDGRPLPAPHEPLPGAPAPVLLEIDSIGVRAQVMERGVDATGGIDPPPYELPDVAGWYAGGPTPGARGPALVVGHVDTDTGQAVFYSLSAVEPGSEVRVTREDGSVAEFTVIGVDVIEREQFDPVQVYEGGQDGLAELRLITCGGTFDRERQSYSANVVVSAYLSGTSPARSSV
ncbi:class F sortase [Streptomyces sodiiphilus]|uniref:Class F sortase n=1 Tax=Streptomyces sodiiphilus TaxID=226217 RepID=A0ABN2PWQ3_9ACTN